MAKQPDDNLESFFLNRISDYKIDYREEDWQNLNEMLDASDVMKAAALRQKIVWIGSGALLVICIVLLIWMSQNLTGRQIDENLFQTKSETVENLDSGDNPDKVKNAEKNQKEENKEDVTQVQVSLDPGIQNSRKSENLIDTDSTRNQVSFQPPEISANQSISDSKGDEDRDPVSSILKNSRSESVSNTRNDNVSNNFIEKEKLAKSKEDLAEKEEGGVVVPSGDSLKRINVGEPNVITAHQLDFKEAASISLSPAGLNITKTNEGESTISSDLRQPYNKLVLRKNFSWNFSIAADNSAVGVSDFSGPMVRAGLSAEYYFSSRTSVLAGVNYSVKEYTAFGKEYKVAYGSWNAGVSPDETFGTCNVLDIPLDFTYYVLNKKGHSFFLRSGISSWLMLEEHYYFSYNSNDPDLVRYWGGKNENYHFFSIFNLSGGFEYPLNPKYSIIAEPYVNIPLGGVGYGSVKLYSAGLQVILKINHYKLVAVE